MPQYRDIAAELMRRIIDGEFPVGSHLPSEQLLADQSGASRSTVRRALLAVSRRGLIVPRRGAGWLVQSASQTQGLDQLRSFAQWARARGTTPGGLIVKRETGPATANEARIFHVRQGEAILRFTRVRSLDGHVVMVERSSWAPWVADCVGGVPDDIDSTTDALVDAGIVVVFGNHRIEAVAASSDDAQLLAVRRSSPLLQVRRETFARDGRAVEIGEDRYVPHAVSFEIRAAGADGVIARTVG